MSKFYSISNRILFLLLVALTVFIPLYPKYPLFNVPTTFVAVRIEDFMIMVVVLLWGVINFHKFRSMFSKTIFRAFLLFWFISGLSVFSSIFITYHVEPHLGLLHWLRRIEYMSLFLVAATTITSRRQIKIMINSVLVAALLVVIYGFGQIYFNFQVISTTNSEFSKGLTLYLREGARVNSTFAGHYDLAVYLSIVLVIIAALLLYHDQGSKFLSFKNIFYKIYLLALGCLSFALLGQTASRISFLAMMVGTSLVFWMGKKRFLLLIMIIASFALVVALPELRHRLVATFTVNVLGGGGPKYEPPAGTVNIFTPEKSIPKESREVVLEQVRKDATDPAKPVHKDVVPGEPINTTELGVYRSFGIRLNVEWPRALNAFYKNPLLGTGYSSISLATDNDYLRSLGETGVLGTFALAIIFYLIIKRLRKYIHDSIGFERYFGIAILASIVALLVSAIFIDVLEASKIAEIFWLMMGVSWAAMTKTQDV